MTNHGIPSHERYLTLYGLLEHENFKNTLLCVQLAEQLSKDEKEFVSRVAKTEKNACELVEAGFEYVCDFDNAKIFRKRKW